MMKKKATRILISVCVVAMLMTCMGVSAFAADTVTYTMKAGDNVYAICSRLGIDFNANRAWITSVNNITNYNNLKVGKVLILPTFNTSKEVTRAAQVLANLKGSAVTSTTTTTTTPVITGAATATGLMAGDTIVSYLVNHVMQAGQTVAGVCSAYGVSFAANSEKIKTLSGITSWNKIPVGKIVVIPSLTAPTGSSYTAIVAHIVRGGETVGGICSNYGLVFGKVQEQLKALNSTNNLNVIKVGQIFYLPVSSAVIGSVSYTGGTGTTGTTTTVVTPTTAQTNNATTTNGSHGSFKLQVNGVDATTAAAGQTVTIVAYPEAGYEVNTVTIKSTDGKQYVTPNGMSFVMPSYPVSIQVTFKKIV